jgi:hypothetical protein
MIGIEAVLEIPIQIPDNFREIPNPFTDSIIGISILDES